MGVTNAKSHMTQNESHCIESYRVLLYRIVSPSASVGSQTATSAYAYGGESKVDKLNLQIIKMPNFVLRFLLVHYLHSITTSSYPFTLEMHKKRLSLTNTMTCVYLTPPYIHKALIKIKFVKIHSYILCFLIPIQWAKKNSMVNISPIIFCFK